MSYKIREEIVGKRFLSVSSVGKLKLSKISEWCWRAGVIRASTHKDSTHKDLQILVEYDDRSWERREWLQVHKFQVLLVERTLIWAPRSGSSRASATNLSPALSYMPIVFTPGEIPSTQKPIEFLRDRYLVFRDPASFKTVQEVDGRLCEEPLVREWCRSQDGQGILLATPSVLVGYRVQVYRAEGTTQWYTAVIVGYNPVSRELTVTDDTVLEDHSEDPCLVQMRLIGDEVVESIMKGENVGITPRRSRSNLTLHRPTVRPKRDGRRRKMAPKKGAAGVTTKPPPRPPDGDKRPSPLREEENTPVSSLPEESDKKATSPSTPEPTQPVPEQTTNGRTLRSHRSHSLDKVEPKSRPAPRAKKKVKKEKVKVKEEEVEKEEEEEEAEEEEEEEVKKGRDEEVGVKEEEEGRGEGRSPREDDDDGPLPLSSPFRMEDSSGGSALRDDRSDSGVSSLRSAGSGDERSGSRSSALSPTPPPTQPAQPSRKIAENWRDSGSGMSGGGPGYPAPGLLIPPPPPLYTALPPELWPPPQPKPPPPPAAIRYTPTSADIYHDRIIRERREQEAHKEREKEREKQERERQERERLEKQRAAEQAVHKHFEESLRLAQQKNRASMGWINTLPAPTPTRADEKQQQQQQQQHQLQQQQQQQAQQQHQQQQEARMLERMREQRTPYHYQSRIKVDYPPPAHSRGPAAKQQPEKPAPLPKAEPNFNLFGGYPSAYQPSQIAFLHHDKKQDQKPALIVTKAEDSVKNTVIVKNDKSPGLHPPSPKLRDAYMPPKSPYEYRSPSQSPHPGAYEAQNLATISKVHTMHRPQHLSPHQRQSPHNHHRQSPHQHHRQSPHQHHPPSPHLHPSPPTVVYTKQATVGSYPYPSPTLHFAPAPPTTPPKPKVSSPAPQVYSKPRPLSRSGEVSKTLTPSPYQQVSQHNLPPPAQVLQQTGLPSPPAAHGAAKGYGLAVKQPPASPPGPGLALTPAFQTQPLDLGVGARETSSPKRKSEEESPPPSVPSPKRVKTEEEPVVVRTSESSPLPCITTQGRESPRPVHKLKKAWLQRHSGEDTTSNSKDELKGGGVCVTLPMPVTTSAAPVVQPAVSIHSIGSMAVNSIKKPKQSRKPKELNGHVPAKSPENDDSSSSDPERKATPQKRVPPKVKRKKGGRKSVPEDAKRKKTSVSSTDSEKESGSDKESDTNSTAGSGERAAAGKKKEEKKEVTAGGKKRGRRPKTSQSKNGNEDESRKSKASSNNSTPATEESSGAPQRDCIQKPSVGHLKKTGESFLQDGPCFEVAPKLAKCRECRWTPNQRNRNMPNIFCRFYAFRRLRYTKNGQLAIAGFSDPHRDALQDDLKLWLPGSAPAGLDEDMSKFLLAQLGDQFCDLLQQEKDAVSIHMSDDKTIAWKRVVQGVREMCDVCETTLFNFHWACGKCGFVVCIDCYKGRKNGGIKMWGEPGRDRDDVSWLLCTNRQAHEQEKLMLTQIIAGDSLSTLGRGVHESRARLKIPQRCACEVALTFNNGTAKDQNGIKKETEDSNSPLSWLADVALSEDKKSTSSEDLTGAGCKDEDDKDSSYSTLRELLIRPSGKSNGSRSASPVSTGGKRCNTSSPPLDTLDQVISSVIDKVVVEEKTASGCSELKHFIRRYKQLSSESLPARVMTMVESASMYPNVPHSWLCEGRLLRLMDSKSPKNYLAFQDVWKRGQPVMISDVTKDMDTELWSPESFQRDFGDTKNDLVDCTTGNTIPNQPMRKFWEGFGYMSKRLKDDDGQTMILKLKDWPPGEDFAEMLPSRFSDLMKVLPMGEYTQRGGRLNLASRLPDCFVRPDLGPKMYTAYGSTKAGTTNLHLDISDAVNVMVYVGMPSDVDIDQVSKEALRAIDEAGCDVLTRRRVREKSQLPGALWHIYMARDADKIRDLLNKVALERGTILEPHHDPIHDQSWYLDSELRDRLYKEYAVEGYSIVQCLGDAVFIPAGAPHQVRNLHNCIKVAEDFVSPENVSHCFHLTQEFRELTDTHTNHEDKLQIKNIVYHAVKDSLAVLSGVGSPVNGLLDR